LRVADVADRLDLSPSSIRRLIDTGKLRSVKLRGAVRVRECDLAQLIAEGLR
jgi:excisionase family DNA binding protein